MKYFFRCLIRFLFFFLPLYPLFAQGNIYLVLGSDTGIWDGLDMTNYHDHYNFDLYTDPQRNAFKVMDPAFREGITDSYGNTLKLTWWIMGGNTFRYADNNNVPLDNTMVLYLMKKYQGNAIEHWGDEVTLHYHDWIWSDYNGDGKYFWNQSTNFSEFKEDFDLTLAQYLIEENVFPVSFRSGWHFMNNDWQNYLNRIIPFSLHDDYPNKHIDTVEPLDNIYDWSESSGEFVPFHPSSQNYQVPGDGKGWDNRSIYMASMDTVLMDHVFSQAAKGIDQVVCIWAHLPEDNFLDNITRINQIVHGSASKYPNVKFRYCTAVEAMQRWLKSYGGTKLELDFSYLQNGDKIDFVIKTDKAIFQDQPFVVLKDINSNYKIIPCYSSGVNEWKSSESFPLSGLAKAGAAVTDTAGNLSTAFINFLPDDIYIDNNDSGYTEKKGNWASSQNAAWDLDSREAVLKNKDTAVVQWLPQITSSRYYNIFIQVPAVSVPADYYRFNIYSNGEIIDSVSFNSPFVPNEWIHLSTSYLTANTNNKIDMISYNLTEQEKTAAADVMKLSALIPERKLSVPQSPLDFGLVSEDDSVSFNLILRNEGIKDLRINDIDSRSGNISINSSFPLVINPLSRITIPLVFHPFKIARYSDTLFIHSNDSLKNIYPVPFVVDVESYFKLVDNEDLNNYFESGVWQTSVAQAYGASSRYAYLGQSPPAYAAFSATLKRSGMYYIEEIVPATVNAAKHALFILYKDNIPADSVYVDQNEGSGEWVTVDSAYFSGGDNIELKILDSGENTPNAVLRADAVKFSFKKEITGVNHNAELIHPGKFELEQNYPNPFNPATTIKYSIPQKCLVTLKVYDILGRLITTLVNEEKYAGEYEARFDGSNLSSGIYLYKIYAGSFTSAKKLVLIK